ncbi:MAG: ROK family protein [Spirochaetaceae bacterium]|nr:ROK family protein [Spirochaetaceae bacterium]
MYRIGVDLGGTNIAVGLVNDDYVITARISVPTNALQAAEGVVAGIGDAIERVLEKSGLTGPDCAGIGVGAPGTCDTERGIVFRSYSLSWNNVPLAAMLEERFHLPVRINNDANCAALAEVKAGAAKGCKNVVLVTLGTGIGSGIVINGTIYSGYLGSGTEMGHMLLDYNGEQCSCGRKGCWDAYASSTALVVQAKRAAFSRPESRLNSLPQITGQSVFEAAEQGDVTAIAIINKYCEYLALGISNIINVLAPEMILIGGGVSSQGERILEPVRKYARENCFDKREEAMPIIKIASMGNEAGIIGAAVL